MATLKSDALGFLVGDPISSAQAVALLGDIKSDTRAIVRAMGLAAQASRRAQSEELRRAVRQVQPSQPGRASERAQAAAVVQQPRAAVPARPAPAAAWQDRPRDARGRWMASGGPAGQRTAEPSAPTAVAKAAAAVASRAAEPAMAKAGAAAAEAAGAAAAAVKLGEREAAREAAAQRVRDARGRFGAGGQETATPGAAVGRYISRLTGALGGAATGGDQIDATLAAASEARGIASRAVQIGRAAVPGWARNGIGRAGRWARGLLGRGQPDPEQRKQTVILGKVLGALRERGGGGGGGLFSTVLAGPLMRLAPLVAPIAAGMGAMATAAAALAKRVPVITGLFELVSGFFKDRQIADDPNLTPEQKADARVQNAAEKGAAAFGAVAGGMLGSAFGPLGTIAGAGLGAYGGQKLGRLAGNALNSDTGKAARAAVADGIGWVSAKFESGRRGAGTVSTGKGDAGGVSYGTHQLSSTRGTVQAFLKDSGYASQFAGLRPGSPEFSAKWKQVADADKGFGKAQHDYITRTHYQPQVDMLKRAGIDLSGRGAAVQEAIYSTAVQYGPQSSVIRKALGGDAAKLTDAEVIQRIQDYKAANNDSLFRSSSPAVRASVLERVGRERSLLLAQAAMPAVPDAVAPPTPPIPRPPTLPAAVAPREAGPGPRPAAPPAAPPAVVVAQEVNDRLIAHIANGGMGRLGGPF